MKELMKQLSNIPDAYDDFISGAVSYAKKDPTHVVILKNYMKSKSDLTSSDVVLFIMKQPDFHSYSATRNSKRFGQTI